MSSLEFLFSHCLPIGSHSSDIDHCRVFLCALKLHINTIIQYILPPNNLLGACWVPGTVPTPGDATVMRQTKSQPSWKLNSAQKGEINTVGGNRMTKGESVDKEERG